MLKIKRMSFFTALCIAALLLLSAGQARAVGAVGAKARSFAVTGSIKGTVSAATGGGDNASTLLAGARLTLANRDLPEQMFNIVTNEAGQFAFLDLPAAVYILTAEADGLPRVTREINLATGASLIVDVVLTAQVSESVLVRDEEGLLSTAETTTVNTIRSQTLTNVPLRAENFQSSLLLTPGAVRTPDGMDHLKGARAGQSLYTVNGVDAVDPVTGALAFDIPIEAASSVQIEENPYSAEFGRLIGGAINLETKSGDNKFRFNAARFFPTFRRIAGGKLDSFRPRVTISGPVMRDRLFFLQSFEYRFSRARVAGLKDQPNDTINQAFNSYTQLDLNLNKSNRLKLVGALFPQKMRYVGLNTFVPQEATPSITQRGALFSISEQAIFRNESFLASTLSYKEFSVDVIPQGTQPLTIFPDTSAGNYFADARRRAPRLQWQETYYARPFQFGGQHSIKLGAEFDRTRVSARFVDESIFIRRLENTLAERIDFAGGGIAPARVTNEVAAFIQDRFIVNGRLTLDAGLRFDRDSLVQRGNVAPRFAFLLLPFKNNRTILRGGAGLFYDRTPLSVGYFTALPERTVTDYAPDGVTPINAPRRFVNLVDGRLRNPRSTRFSLQLDRGLTKNFIARIGYLQRNTTNEFIIAPLANSPNLNLLGSNLFGANASASNALLLNSAGNSRYRELQVLATYDGRRAGNFTASYTRSSARGDLNAINEILGDVQPIVIRPNERGPLSFDAPHRLLAYGEIRAPSDLRISPVIEVRSGFPFSLVNERLEYVSRRNEAGRFPTFVSLDLQVTKGFKLPFKLPIIENKRLRAGVAVFNITNHFNPRDVQQNINSPRAGQFFNSLGTSVRGKLELDF